MCNYVAYNRFYKLRFLRLYLLFLIPLYMLATFHNVPGPSNSRFNLLLT